MAAGCVDREDGFVRASSLVNLGGEYEVALGEAADGVGVDFEARVAPAEGDVRVVAFRLGHRADAVDEGERVGEVRELVSLVKVVLFDDAPAVQLTEQRLNLVARETRHSPVTRHALLTRKTLH